MPKNNKKDLEDIPKSVLETLSFHFVEHMDEVLKIVLVRHLAKLEKPAADVIGATHLTA
jgi:ATP-dependent Lon protease